MGPCCSGVKLKAKTMRNREEAPEILLLEPQEVPRPKSKRLRVNSVEELHLCELPQAIFIDKIKGFNDIRLLKDALLQNTLFAQLPAGTFDRITSAMRCYSVAQGQVIYQRGTPGCSLFVLATGQLEAHTEHSLPEAVCVGSIFGETALFTGSTRDCTVTASAKSEVWRITRTEYFSVIRTSTSERQSLLLSFISTIPLLSELSSGQKEKLIDELEELKYGAGEVIINEGDQGTLCYLIMEGTVSCMKDGEVLRELTVGEYFGEQALLYEIPRSATIVALGSVVVFGVKREALTAAFGEQLSSIIYRNSLRIAIDQSEYLESLSYEQVERMVANIEIQSYSGHSIVIEEGAERATGLWVLLKGELLESRTDCVFRRFAILGEEDMVRGNCARYSNSIKAQGDADVGFIPKDRVTQALGHELHQIRNYNKILSTLYKVQLLRLLPKDKLENITRSMTSRKYSPNETIITEGEPGDEFFIINTGTVLIVKGEVVLRQLGPLGSFGERAILLNEPRTASAVALCKAKCWVLSRSQFLAMVTEDIQKYLLTRMHLQDDTVQLNSLSSRKKLGAGAFGHVYLATDGSKHCDYALKSISRRKIRAFKLYEAVRMERRILTQLDHPMIVKLVKTFKDEHRVYFLLEYAEGTDFFDALAAQKAFTVPQSRFYSECLVLMLEHLHNKNIVYRDLKPENLLIDLEGYPKLIDFGTSKLLTGRTSTTVGTPHYMAPEMITGSAYGLAVDYWALGIMIYEFLTGKVPFGNELEDPFRVYECILRRRLSYPKQLDKAPAAREIISHLLEPKPSSRGTLEGIKQESWFASTDWEKVLFRAARAPYKPPAPRLPSCTTELFSQLLIDEKGDELLPDSRVPADSVNWDKHF